MYKNANIQFYHCDKLLLGIKRVYDKPSLSDGKRILVDRLWPRGVKKSTSNIDLWLKEVAPSNELRKWFSHDPEKWEDFKERYKKELKGNASLEELRKIINDTDVTLIYGAKDEKHNNALVLVSVLHMA